MPKVAPNKGQQKDFELLCAALPESTMWGDLLTPHIVRHILYYAASHPEVIKDLKEPS